MNHHIYNRFWDDFLFELFCSLLMMSWKGFFFFLMLFWSHASVPQVSSHNADLHIKNYFCRSYYSLYILSVPLTRLTSGVDAPELSAAPSYLLWGGPNGENEFPYGDRYKYRMNQLYNRQYCPSWGTLQLLVFLCNHGFLLKSEMWNCELKTLWINNIWRLRQA